ncbi:hypothetical protein [Microbacterium ulmi]|uniref:WD40 repeat protein n=1 Tax=Microbacterium ulmi TaxID=179095 RepID=A0A7Y2M412_9MICO|nr:hypothetical protein [Microbacterium ulmi]NII69108.1 hypothetical protein [Microbacterium ulmi]NNH04698.1 hypothetical protein [Microbacterium ulmi]
MIQAVLPRRAVATTGIAALLLAGLVTVAAPDAPAADAAPLPAGAETFEVAGGQGGASDSVFLTADAQRVVFTSTADDLVAGDANGLPDVFLSTAAQGSDDPFSGTPTLVSTPDGPVGAARANGASDEAVASMDGRIVAFTSSATNLVDLPSTGDGRTYVYVRDTLKNTTFRIQGSAEPNGSSSRPDLSDDGRRLVFTSDADNLGAPGDDVNGAQDSFVVDLDADGDGTYGDLELVRLFPGATVPTGTRDAVISGNGRVVGILTRWSPEGGSVSDLDTLYALTLDPGELGFLPGSTWIATRVLGRASIDATGRAFAYVQDAACGEQPTVIASALGYSSGAFSIAVGTIGADQRSGSVADPVISADASTVAWTTTVPAFDFGNGGVPSPPLPEPVVRMQRPSWWDSMATEQVPCSGILFGEWYDVAEGSHASLSASGRTVAFQTPGPGRIHVVDSHSNDGLSIANTQGQIIAPSFVTEVPISSIPLASLRGYAATLADSPIYRLPIYRLPIYRLPIYRLPIYRLLVDDSPIYRLPIYRLPIYRLPIYRLDLPGGWPQVLEGTPFQGELIQTVTLDDVLAWANENPGTDAGIRIRSLTLVDVGLEGSGLDSLSLASYALGGARVADLPIPGTGSTAARWQARIDAQGLQIRVDDDTVLAELDAAGLDIAASGIDLLSLSGLDDDVIDDTLLGSMQIDPALLPGTPLGDLDVTTLDASALTALFGDAGITGTLAAPSAPLLGTATFGDLAKGASSLTFGTVLFSLLDAESYPWEQVAATSIDPRAASRATGMSCVGGARCGTTAPFRFTFDAGPGDPTGFEAPTASITLPAGTVPILLVARGSGPYTAWNDAAQYDGPLTTDGQLVTVPMADTQAGTVFELDATYSFSTVVGHPLATASLTSGSQRVESALGGEQPLALWDDPEHNWSPETGWQPGHEGVVLKEGTLYYEWISPAWLDNDDNTGQPIQGPAGDEDFYLVDAPPPGKRLVISTNASDGQVSLSLYGSRGADPDAARLGLADAGPVPGTLVTEQTGAADAPAEAGADAGTGIPGQVLLDQSVQRGTGRAEVEAASTDAAAGERLLVRVASGDGRASSSMYSLRVQYIAEPVESVCSPWVPVPAEQAGRIGVSDPVTDDTNTVYLMDTQRYGDTYGADGADAVREALEELTGTGRVDESTVQGAVLSVDADDRVRAARSILDQNPCSMQARRGLTAAINTYVAEQLGDRSDRIRSVVIVGGDDIVPMAPVPQHTSQFTEQSHAADLRLAEPIGGGACPAEVAPGALDACATPLSAAAAASDILTDDPYGLANAYQSLGGFLYVPTTALGRLVETPDQIRATVERFIDAEGVLEADSTVTAGYGAWSELPDDVTTALSWRSTSNATLGSTAEDGTWDLDDVTGALFPGEDESPAVVSINTHADERRMLPGVPGAEKGVFQDADLFTSGSVSDADAEDLAGSLIFLIGCHAGNDLPTAYYGEDSLDWVDVFSRAGGYVGNTGYGLANNVTTALGERLLALYADWIGVEADGRKVSASEALTYAKQSYLGGLGLYSGYDEKVLMGAVYYGLPMYTFADAATTKTAPVPRIPAELAPLRTSDDGLSSASLSLTPAFQKRTVQDAAGKDVSYLVADGQSPAVVAGQPVLPKLVSQLRAEEGLTPRGVLISGLTSEIESGVTPAIAQPGVGVDQTSADRTGAAFPSSFATITRQDTPDGPADFVVVTPGRVQAPRGGAVGTGALERFTRLDLEIVYADETSDDTTPPAISGIDTSRGFEFRVDGTGSAVARGILLVQYEGDTQWLPLSATISASGAGRVQLPDDDRAYRWILQAADAAGNVAVDTNRGQLPVEDAPAPVLEVAGAAATVPLGEALRRAVEVTDATAGDALTARLALEATDGSAVGGGSIVPVVTGDDGRTRAVIDQRFTTPGAYIATLTVCRGRACSDLRIEVSVPLPNSAPTASVTLTSDTDPVEAGSRLTAHAVGADPDGDAVTLAYAWTRNGAPLADQSGSTLWLAEVGATPGDVIRVTVTPSDGLTEGHAAAAEATVATPPPVPQISASATNASGAYVEGSWSTTPVTVTFTCSGIAALDCSAPQTVSADTGTAGVVVTGTVHDILGRTATTSIRVHVDATAPALAPSVTPPTVAQGGTATATANATDAGSGVATQSCDTPLTSTPGPASVACRATDNAGNTATSAAVYTVQAPSAKTCKGVLDRTAQIPLEADGSSVFLRTSGVPITFRACDADGKPIGTKGFVRSVTLVSTTTLPKNAKINELWYIPITGFVYVKAADAWLGQISTVKLAGGKKYTYKVLLADGTSFTFTFGVK